ncbi:MAG: imidazolonepropionase-like amidohydrolase [Flavobacteriales bacterium]|jgi:imidazolonepropionase-like amidohydrolase
MIINNLKIENMKKGIVLMLTFMLIGSAGIFAQNAEKEGDRSAEKKAFMNEKLALTESEQAKFWPLMEEMKKELKENRKSFKDAKPEKGEKIDDMSDADVEKMLNAGFDMKEKDNAIRKAYNDKFIAVIGAKRTAKMYHLERQFKKKKAAHNGGKPAGKGTTPPGK